MFGNFATWHIYLLPVIIRSAIITYEEDFRSYIFTFNIVNCSSCASIMQHLHNLKDHTRYNTTRFFKHNYIII